jgi:hypothetical protein
MPVPVERVDLYAAGALCDGIDIFSTFQVSPPSGVVTDVAQAPPVLKCIFFPQFGAALSSFMVVL